jgi:methionyl-tRNA formyltransferase
MKQPAWIFFGTPEIARIVLEKIIDGGFIPAAIVTNPDRPAGRKKIITAPAVKQFAIDRGLNVPILQPEKLSEIREILTHLAPDFFLVAAYGKIVPKSILDIAPLGTIGVHPSLLPLYRGASPIQTAILDGALETGVTLYMIDEKMDEGPILLQEKLSGHVPDVLANTELSAKLASLGGEMAMRVIPKLLDGSAAPLPQDHARATYTKKFLTEDGEVKEDDLKAAQAGGNLEKALMIHRKILAFTPEPGVWTIENGVRTKLLESKMEGDKLVLKTIQKEGKKPQQV